jgi:hypothetical protein
MLNASRPISPAEGKTSSFVVARAQTTAIIAGIIIPA